MSRERVSKRPNEWAMQNEKQSPTYPGLPRFARQTRRIFFFVGVWICRLLFLPEAKDRALENYVVKHRTVGAFGDFNGQF